MTNDVVHRIVEHNRAKGARYTRHRRPVRLVYWEEANSKSSAARREALIKTWSRSKKLSLIGKGQNHNPSRKAFGVKQNHSPSLKAARDEGKGRIMAPRKERSG
jgi:predicted GIY-YIG superfamily endonuclease